MSDIERRKILYPDLARVEDWLNAKGYTGEAGAVHVAMDEILEGNIEITRLREENARLREALLPFVQRLEVLEETLAHKYAYATNVDVKHLRAAEAAIREGGK